MSEENSEWRKCGDSVCTYLGPDGEDVCASCGYLLVELPHDEACESSASSIPLDVVVAILREQGWECNPPKEKP